MKIYNQIGSKQRLIEMFKGVSGIQLNESAYPTTMLDDMYNKLNNQELNIYSSNTQVQGNKTFIELNCHDENKSEIMFSFAVTGKPEDQEGVYDVTNISMIGFRFTNNNSSDTLEIDENGLNEFNNVHQNEYLDIISKYIDFDEKTPEVEDIDEAFYDAIKKIDSYPYGGTPRTMKTSSAYGDEQPTNPKLRVNASELKKFVDEDVNVENPSNIINNYQEKLSQNKKVDLINKAKTVVNNFMKANNKSAENIGKKMYFDMVKDVANRIYVMELEEMNESEDYPNEIGKKFKTKKQYRGEVKKKASTTNISENNEESLADTGNGENLNVGDVVTVGGLVGEYQVGVNYSENKPYLMPYDTITKKANSTYKIYLTSLVNPQLKKITSFSDTDGGFMSETNDVEINNPELYPKGWKELDGIFMNKSDDNEDNEMADVLLGYKPKNVGQEIEEGIGRTKTFKIGEYAVGGIIKVDISENTITIQALDWNTKKSVDSETFTMDDINGMDGYLNELTSSYYAGKIMDWIKSPVNEIIGADNSSSVVDSGDNTNDTDELSKLSAYEKKDLNTLKDDEKEEYFNLWSKYKKNGLK